MTGQRRRVRIRNAVRIGHGDVHRVAGLVLAVDLVVAQALHFEVRGFEVGIGDDQHPNARAGLDLAERVALFIEQVSGHIHRHDGAHFGAAFLDRFFLQ